MICRVTSCQQSHMEGESGESRPGVDLAKLKLSQTPPRGTSGTECSLQVWKYIVPIYCSNANLWRLQNLHRWPWTYLFILLLWGLLLIGDLDLRFLRLLGLLHLFLHLELLGEAGNQLGLEPLGAQRATVQLLTEVVHLGGGRGEVRGGTSRIQKDTGKHLKPTLLN